MVFEVGGKLLKEYGDERYKRAFNQAFTGFPNDVGFNNGLSAPQPDFIEGLEMEEFRPFPVDEHVEGAVLYKDNPGSLTLPHIAGEWKGTGKDMEKAAVQAGYDGAALVYARRKALAYLGQPDPPGHAEITTFATDGTNINFYAHYAAPAEENGRHEYHQYQYASVDVKNTYQGHKDGRKSIRNGQDHARDQSHILRDQLKKYWKQRHDAESSAVGAVISTDLDGIPEETSPARESGACPDDDGDVEAPPPPAKFARHQRASRHAPVVRGADDEPGYEIIDPASYAPTPSRLSEERRRSSRLSKPRSLRGGSANAPAR